MNPNHPIADEKKAHQGYVLACLFRHADNDNSKSLSPNCFGELKRAMRERALSVHLQPGERRIEFCDGVFGVFVAGTRPISHRVGRSVCHTLLFLHFWAF